MARKFQKFWPLALLLPALSNAETKTHHEGRTTYHAPHTATAPSVDGVADETIWEQAVWQVMDKNWLGPEYSSEDFQGRYKVVWSGNRIYLMAEIVDDVLFDRHRDPLKQYWDDDSLEIFIDEDFSGGNHQYNHNAFAYHMSLDNKAIDIGTDKLAHDYSHHATSVWKQQGEKLIWEVAFDLYDDTYVDDADTNEPVQLSAGKVMGLMVAYCDNDGSELRENFVGSEVTIDGKTDQGWIDAGLFGKLVLDE